MQTVSSLLRFSLFWLRLFFSFSLSLDGKPSFQPEKATRGRMPFPRPPPSSNSNPMSNTSSNFQTPKTNWKWLHPGAVFNDGCNLRSGVPIFFSRTFPPRNKGMPDRRLRWLWLLSSLFVSFINLGWNEFRYLGTSIIKARRFVNYTTRIRLFRLQTSVVVDRDHELSWKNEKSWKGS